MRLGTGRLLLCAGIVLGILAAAAPAIAAPRTLAYLDPGTGSYLFQVVVGTVLGVAVSIKLMWRRAWARVTRRSDRQPQQKDT